MEEVGTVEERKTTREQTMKICMGHKLRDADAGVEKTDRERIEVWEKDEVRIRELQEVCQI